MSSVDIAQTIKYKQMLGLTNINSTTESSTLQASVSILGNLYVSGYSTLNGSVTINSNLNVSGNTILYNRLTNNSDLYVYNNFNSLSSISVKSNLNCQNILINGNLNLNNYSVLPNLTCYKDVSISGLIKFNNSFNINSIGSIGDSLNINGDKINIGNINSTININGTTTYFAVNQVKLLDKIVSVNLNSNTSSTTNIGDNCGFEIYSSSGKGFILTSPDAMRYQIKAPMDSQIKYISTVDNDNNLSISGNTILYGPLTTFSQLYVNGNTVINGNTIFNGSLITSGNTVFQNSSTFLSNIIISGDTILYNDATMNSSFSVNGTGNLRGNTTIRSTLNINSDTTVNGAMTLFSDLNIFGSSLLQGNTSLNSGLYVSGQSVIQGTTTILSSLNIIGNANILGTTTVATNLNVSDKSLLQGLTNLNSNLNVNGNIIINGNMTIGSILGYSSNNYSNLYILGQMISKLPHYNSNSDAVAGGVPLWGFYRTGGILKIRLNNIPPTIELIGASTIIINYGTSYIDPGINAYDIADSYVVPYLISISNSQITNIIATPIPILGNNTIISDTNSLLTGIYVITYSATDNAGNTSAPLYRTLIVS
uniref:Pesticidal crystal protein Cry22Aa Ig-like domain-containing protein n=1 Tax=viral metagenome TaxID=1070528 RepID=A0A6C0ED22_9ZZZZ